MDTEVQKRFEDGLRAAAHRDDFQTVKRDAPLPGVDIKQAIFDARLIGFPSIFALEPWEQTRTVSGELFQSNAFGPLPGAIEAESRVIENRLCDSWFWKEKTIENCQLVFRVAGSDRYFLAGETGWYSGTLSQ